MKKLREKIMKILIQNSNTYDYKGDLADRILFLPIAEGKLWVEKKCTECDGLGSNLPAYIGKCKSCLGTGIIRRPATWADVDMEIFELLFTLINLLQHIQGGYKASIGSLDNTYTPQLCAEQVDELMEDINKAITTPDGGRLIWEEK